MFTQLDYMEKRGSGLRKMRELTEKLPNLLPGKEPHYKTEASSFFTTFYNLNWNEAGNIPVEKVAQRAYITLNEFSVNKESSEEKFGEKVRRGRSKIQKCRKNGTENHRSCHFGPVYIGRSHGLQYRYQSSCCRKTDCQTTYNGNPNSRRSRLWRLLAYHHKLSIIHKEDVN